MSNQYQKVATRYAKALLKTAIAELGSEGTPSPAQQLASSLEQFAEVWVGQKELRQAVLNPMFERKDRSSALMSVLDQMELPELSRKFIRVVFEKDRIAALPAIAEVFRIRADQAASVVQVRVSVARDIENSEQEEIEGSLKQLIAGNLEFIWRVDSSILGGMSVEYQGKVLDGSLRGRLQRLEQQLMA